jgi:enolase-phosphatase E1
VRCTRVSSTEWIIQVSDGRALELPSSLTLTLLSADPFLLVMSQSSTRFTPQRRLLLASAAALSAVALGALALRWWKSRCRTQPCSAASSCSASGPLSLANASPRLPYALLLFDVEGTTTPISFVKETLFPFVLRNVREYLERTYSSQQTRADIQALREQATADRAAGQAAPQIPAVPAEGDGQALKELLDAVAANVAWQMSSDRKAGPLKTLQGHMWTEGYASGELKGELFGGANGDVATQMRAWARQGYTLGIYSSGSVGAQKLLFGHSDAGDLTPLLKVHFDTNVGMKQQADSYRKIARAVGLEANPGRILFFTDICE